MSPVARQARDLLNQCCTLEIWLSEIHWQDWPTTVYQGTDASKLFSSQEKENLLGFGGWIWKIYLPDAVYMFEMFSPPTTWILFLNGKWLTVEARVNRSVMFSAQLSWVCIHWSISCGRLVWIVYWLRFVSEYGFLWRWLVWITIYLEWAFYFSIVQIISLSPGTLFIS